MAQVADVMGGRSAPMNEEQRAEAKKTVVGEFSSVKHVRGILSMGRLVLCTLHYARSYYCFLMSCLYCVLLGLNVLKIFVVFHL